ncbi:unnamed protein product [Brassica rapa subsp. narinosa]
MVVSLRRTRRSGRFTRAGSSNPPPEALPASSPVSSFAHSALMNPDSTHSPLYLHHADHPGLMIISVQLDGSNFGQWNSAMKIALDAKNKIAFVDNSLPRPDVNDPLFRIWSRCNSMVKSWILNSVSKQIYGSILSFDDAAQIWNDLHARFHKTNLPRTFQLVQQIQDLRQGSMDLSLYYTTLKTLWDNLDCSEVSDPCACCNAVNCAGQRQAQARVERSRTIKFLAGLNEKYSVIRSQIIMKKPLPDLAEICNILDQDDSQRQFNSPIPAAYNLSSNPPLPPLLPTPQNSASPDPTPGALYAFQKKDNRPMCSHCGVAGHIIDRCYKLHGYPVGWKKGKPIHSKPASSSAVTAAVSASDRTSGGNLDSLVGNLSKDQIQEFIAYFSSQLQPSSSVNNLTASSVASTSQSSSGSFQGIDDWKR